VAALDALVGALGALPGPKTVFYVSGGLEQRPGIDLFHQLGEICPAALQSNFSQVLAPMQEYDLSGAFQALAARANASRVRLNTVDAAGIQNLSGADVSHDDRRTCPPPGPTGSASRISRRVRSSWPRRRAVRRYSTRTTCGSRWKNWPATSATPTRSGSGPSMRPRGGPTVYA
jgi:hypothetical protein